MPWPVWCSNGQGAMPWPMWCVWLRRDALAVVDGCGQGAMPWPLWCAWPKRGALANVVFVGPITQGPCGLFSSPGHAHRYFPQSTSSPFSRAPRSRQLPVLANSRPLRLCLLILRSRAVPLFFVLRSLAALNVSTLAPLAAARLLLPLPCP